MEAPLKPDPSDCCNSGCNPCILDVYEEQLKKYEKEKNTSKKFFKNCMSQTSYSIFKLVNVEQHTRDSYLYTFEFVKPLRGECIEKNNVALLYEPGQHFLIKATDDDEFTRAYTPIPMKNIDNLRFTVLIKLYNNGKMSRYLKNLNRTSETLWRGPYGDFKIKYDYKSLFCIAQGTGIAPIYSVINKLLENEECYTFVTLFFCCGNENIMLRDKLYEFSHYWNFRYELFVNNINNFSGKYKELYHLRKLGLKNIEEYVLKNKDMFALICGSDFFSQNIKNYVIQCNVSEQYIYVF